MPDIEQIKTDLIELCKKHRIYIIASYEVPEIKIRLCDEPYSQVYKFNNVDPEGIS